MPRDPTRHPLDDRIRAQHMLDAARDATTFIATRERADLHTDSMLVRALINAIQEIGEAASKISQPGRDRLPQVPWNQIVGMRHRLVHGYWEVNYDYLWEVATRDLGPLIEALEKAFVGWPLPPPRG